jgi:hypothetical protein
MLNFIKRHFVWKTVGYMSVKAYVNHTIHPLPVFLRMTQSGRRKIAASRKETYVAARRDFDIDLWLNGGPFPSAMKVSDDSVKEFLVNMVDTEFGLNRE